jgi:peroxiredoxin
MRKRLLILPLSALVILGLVVYRAEREAGRPPPALAQPPAERRLAPRFQLYDQQNQVVKFERYLGRTRLVVVFFDGLQGADADPYLAALRDSYDDMESLGVQVIGISRAKPVENRQAEERAGAKFPFPVLTDIGDQSPAPLVHQKWGLYDAVRDTTRTGVFLVDRTGMVPWRGGYPLPVEDAQRVVETLCRGEWPASLQ